MTATTPAVDRGDEHSPEMTPEDRAEAILERVITFKGGSRRSGQVQMARTVAKNLTSKNPTLLQGGTGIGKALDVDTPIPTPNGFVRMGDLQVGDEVFDELGEVCRVTHAFEVMDDRPCFEVVFSDGSSLVADQDHQWDTIPRASVRGSSESTSQDLWESAATTTTSAIADTLWSNQRGRTEKRRPTVVTVDDLGKKSRTKAKGWRLNHTIPVAGAVQTKPRDDLPMEPYALGLWLGGTRARGDIAYVKSGNAPKSLPGFSNNPEAAQVAFTPSEETLATLEQLGVRGGDKHIPSDYLFASTDQRFALLAGLLDASAFVVRVQRQSVGQVQFTESSERLAKDVHALVCSLGMRPTINPRYQSRPSKRSRQAARVMTMIVAFTPSAEVFRAAHVKNERLGVTEDVPSRTAIRAVAEVRSVESRPVRCISVDSPRRLYLAGTSFIPTHNSIGYLAGALATGKQVVIAPHTKALQDQLAADLDLITEALADKERGSLLDHSPTYAIIKGRGSYLCMDKVFGAEDAPGAEGEEQGTLVDAKQPADMGDVAKSVLQLTEWAKTTDSGDRSEVWFPVDGRVWDRVSVSAEACKGKGCDFYRSEDRLCFAERVRQKAKEADIIVVNQAYLAMAMRYPAMLPPDVEAIIVDEAHEFASVVANTFGAQLTVRRLRSVLEKTNPLKAGSDRVDQHQEAISEAIDEFEDLPVPRSADRTMVDTPQAKRALEKLAHGFDKLVPAAEAMPGTDEKEVAARDIMKRMLANVCFDIELLLKGATDTQVAWVEPHMGKARYRSAQFDVSDTIYDRLLEKYRSVVFTSATLTVAGRFEQPAKTYGFASAPWRGEIVESPFDYATQGLVWTPDGLPAPNAKGNSQESYLAEVAAVAEKVVKAAGGRTLVLCTSRSAVQVVADHLRRTVGDSYPLLVQEPGVPIKPLAEEFRADPRSVLVGTRSFWTGVSMEGETCQAVVIDKIPFPSPGEPIIAARAEKLDREGRSGFGEVFLAEACLTVVQGAGRLIRTVDDRGVVVVCDPRAHAGSPHRKGYGRDIMASLPPFPVTTDEHEAMAFLRKIDTKANSGGSALGEAS